IPVAMPILSKKKSDSCVFANHDSALAAILLRQFMSPACSRVRGRVEFWDLCNPQMRILLVEDHPESRRVLQRLIERRGHEVTAVGSAEEAEVELAKQLFPFLILDWMLPGKSGV